jgi:hypothetical protein
MILISIAGNEHDLEEVGPDWIVQQIERRRRDGLSVCVAVSIRTSDLNIRLSTPECAGRAGGERLPNSEEAIILDLWRHLGLDQNDWAPGKIVAFLRRLNL